jgi:hypothetical protein
VFFITILQKNFKEVEGEIKVSLSGTRPQILDELTAGALRHFVGPNKKVTDHGNGEQTVQFVARPLRETANAQALVQAGYTTSTTP